MPELVIELNISADQLLAYYRGDARAVRARAVNGQTVQFPISVLQKHVMPDGIHGVFRMEVDANNKFIRIERVSS